MKPLLPILAFAAVPLSAQLVYEGFNYPYITVGEVTPVSGVFTLPATNGSDGLPNGAPFGGSGTNTFSVDSGPNAGTYPRSNGGTGWLNAWESTNFANSKRRTATGLTWPGLPTVGIAAEDRSTGSTDSQTLLRRQFNNAHPSDGTLLSDPGDVIWTSYLFQTYTTTPTQINSDTRRGMGNVRFFSNSNVNTLQSGFGVYHRVIDTDSGPGVTAAGQLIIGIGALTPFTDFPSGGFFPNTAGLSYPIGVGNTNFVVLRTTFGARGAAEGTAAQGAGVRQEMTVDLWLNPDLAVGIDLATPSASLTGASSGIGNWFTTSTDSSGSGTWRGATDEFRIGLTSLDVGVPIAVPEPTTVALLAGLGALGLAALRRRRS